MQLNVVVCTAHGRGTEQTEGEEGSVLGTSWFLSRSQCLGSSSSPIRMSDRATPASSR